MNDSTWHYSDLITFKSPSLIPFKILASIASLMYYELELENRAITE